MPSVLFSPLINCNLPIPLIFPASLPDKANEDVPADPLWKNLCPHESIDDVWWISWLIPPGENDQVAAVLKSEVLLIVISLKPLLLTISELQKNYMMQW